nr:uncharacterized mitochondrial protein AtMg00810-like [Tanacetum cinerariifolium]
MVRRTSMEVMLRLSRYDVQPATKCYQQGIEASQGNDCMEIKQERYARKILKEAGIKDCNATLYPMEKDLKLSKDKDELKVKATQYQNVSATGHCFYLDTSPITWCSQKQTTMALSSCEAEFMATIAVVLSSNLAKEGIDMEEDGYLLLTEEGIINTYQNFIDEPPLISLNAMSSVNIYRTMRVKGCMGKNALHVLLDSGSPYNFARPANCLEIRAVTWSLESNVAVWWPWRFGDGDLVEAVWLVAEYQNEIRAESIAKNANPLALVAAAQLHPDPYYQASKSHKSYAPTSKASPPTRSNETTRHKGKETAKPITPPSESASEEDSNPEQAQKDKEIKKNLALTAKTVIVARSRETLGSQIVHHTGIQCFNYKEFSHFAKECRKPKRVKDSTYHKEKMLLCKQVEKGVLLQAEQSDWLADTNEEIDEQELEAHYSFMAKIQEVPTADSGTDTKPLKLVQYNARYNVFANKRQRSEQPDSISNICVVEKVDSNVILD